MGKLIANTEDFQKAAIQFDRDLLKIPVLTVRDTTQYMTMRTGITNTVLIGSENVSAQFAPYKANRKSSVDLNLTLRSLTPYFGSLNAEFEPNEAISTLMGHKASQAMDGGLETTVTAKEVLAMIAKSASASLNDAIWTGKRKPSGTESKDLFDGFDTITAQEITAGEISEAKKNLIVLTEAVTKDNAVKVIKNAMFKMDPQLRAQECFLFCSQDIADAYNEGYMETHKSLQYNDKYEQVYVEGSGKKLTIVPLASKTGSSFIHIAPKANMVVGVDQESDIESVKVKDYAPDTLTFMMRLFFGVQFKSIDKSQLLVIKLPEPTTTE